MAGVLAWLRWDLRRRWVSLAVLGLLTAFATGTVLTAAAGAHRGDTALPRLRAQTLPTDALVVANLPGIDWGPVDALPYVTAYSHFFLGGGGGKFPEDDITSVTGFARDDSHWMRSIERPVVLEGRMLDVNDPLEAVITRGVEDRGYHVGQVLPYRLASPAQADRAELDELPYADLAGPELQIRIVGVVIAPWALQDGGAAVDVELSPALLQRYRSSFTGTSGKAGWENDQLRLAHGAADIPQLREDLKRITGQAIDVWNYDEGYDHLQSTDRREAGFLLAFAIAALVASMLLIGQALGRSVATSVAELDSARALGMEPRQVTVAAVLGPVAACWTGAVLGGVVAAYASRWFPIGTAASAEPSPGTRIDWPVLGAGLLLVAGLLLA
ncbi:MAG TPA: FtsX-like permease family protein, partial [Nocardioides sp.]|nr:FtsX-like permease family protein [Nocardioides sp.]